MRLFHRIYLIGKLSQKFRKSENLGSTRSIASKLGAWSQIQICIDFPIENILRFHQILVNISFWDLVSNFEAIDLVDPKIFDFRKFLNNLSSRYIVRKNIKIDPSDHLNICISSHNYFLSDFQHFTVRFVQRA